MQIFLRLSKYIKLRLPQFIMGTILSILSAALSIYAPMIGSQMIDEIANQYKKGQSIAMAPIFQSVSYYMLIVVIGIIFAYFAFMILSKASLDITQHIRNQAHEHMQKLPISFFDDKPAGKISARIVNDTDSLFQNFYLNFMNQILLNLIMVIGIYFAIFRVNARIGFGLLWMIPVFIIWQIIYMKWIHPINLKWREIISQLNSQIAELIQGVSIVQIFQRQETMYQEFVTTNQDWTETRTKQLQIEGLLSWNFSGLLQKLVTLLIMIYLGTQFTSGVFGFSIGTLYLLMEYTSRLFDPITMIVRLISFVQQAIAAGTRIFELMDTPIEEDKQDSISIDQGVVEFDHVNFAYKEDHYVLKDINIKVEQGQTLGLVGHTGSGKSSIINLLFRFYDPQEGQVKIDGLNIRDYNRESIRSFMGIVLQEPYLFSGTIASNVSMNDPSIDEDKVRESLLKVGAGELLDKLEKGIHEPVVEKGQTLSSGERQLISFARALACDPKILILDEATSHIDTETEAIIQHAMQVVQEGRTTFIVAHRLSTIQKADRILVLDQGQIIEEGSHKDLLALDGTYAEMYRMQSEV